MISVITKLHKFLESWPNEVISILLILVGAFTIIVGLFFPVEIKAIILAWEVLP